jgi:hypothetical protein
MPNEPIPDYGDHMTLEEFTKSVQGGCFIDWDGSGYYATATEMSHIPARPSEIIEGSINKEFTHVVWFNK